MTRFRWLSLIVVVAALPLIAAQMGAIPAAVQRAMQMFRPRALAAHDEFLSSDLLEGRGPGTRGDDLAMRYIAAQFEADGLQPAGDNGTYYQRVPLIGVTMEPDQTSLSFTKEGAGSSGPLKYLEEFVATDQAQVPSSAVDSELVFVGHGVVAPEYHWDDYKGFDVHGKTLVMLVDQPPETQPKPNVRTYYGRWTYKYEIGAAKGATGVILIHTNKAAGYPWSVVRNSWGTETDYVKLAPGAPSLQLAAWITEPVAENLFKAAGYDLDALTKEAASPDFKPVPLGFKLTGNISSRIREFDTANVVAKLEGSDPKLRDEAVFYTAHHDHFGIGKPDA